MPNVGGEEEGVGVVCRNLHPGDQEMGTPGVCSPASGSSLEKTPQPLPPRMQPPGSGPRACLGNDAGTSASLLRGETRWSLLLRLWGPGPGSAVVANLATESQTLQRVKLGPCCARDSALGESAKPPLRLHNSEPQYQRPSCGGDKIRWEHV